MAYPIDLVRGIRDRAVKDIFEFSQTELTTSLAELAALHQTSMELLGQLQRVSDTANRLLYLYGTDDA